MITITIQTTNAAFEDNQFEVARILRELAEAAENDALGERKLRDINGNTVGKVEIDE